MIALPRPIHWLASASPAKFFLVLLMLALLAWSGGAQAMLVEGKDYIIVPDPEEPRSGGRVEVLVFFWYGCPHCYHMQPHLRQWLERKPADVDFSYVPAFITGTWAAEMRLFYTLEVLGELERLHGAVFTAFHGEKTDLHSEQVLFNWVAAKGIDAKRFANTFDSVSVGRRVTAAAKLTRRYKVLGVPTVVVGGRYMTSGKYTGSVQATVAAIDELVKMARRDRATKQ